MSTTSTRTPDRESRKRGDGLAIATLGSVVFEVDTNKIFTPKNISGTVGSDWSAHSVVHGKPAQEWIGQRARSYTFDILLRAQDGVRPRSTLQRLQRMAESAQAHWFVVGGQTVGDAPFILKEMSEEWGAVLKSGTMISCNVSLTLEEYR